MSELTPRAGSTIEASAGLRANLSPLLHPASLDFATPCFLIGSPTALCHRALAYSPRTPGSISTKPRSGRLRALLVIFGESGAWRKERNSIFFSFPPSTLTFRFLRVYPVLSAITIRQPSASRNCCSQPGSITGCGGSRRLWLAFRRHEPRRFPRH